VKLALLLSFVSLISTQLALAVEPKNPVTLCERFISPKIKSDCEKRIEKLGPDWYLASVCEKQFEDVQFFECLQLSASQNFSPTKLDQCDQVGIPDKERINCLLGIAEKNGGKNSQVFQDDKAVKRQPARSN
jgi:hypothetical protein